MDTAIIPILGICNIGAQIDRNYQREKKGNQKYDVS